MKAKTHPNQHVFCAYCVYPTGLQVKHPQTGETLKFSSHSGKPVCECCESVLAMGLDAIRRGCDAETERFLATRKSILFAYSGGLDSTAVLTLLSQECRTRGIRLDAFTIMTGVKGKVAEDNIRNVIRHLGLQDSHRMIDITHATQDDPAVLAVTGKTLTTFEVYRHCAATRTLPCGKMCNRIIDRAYAETMRVLGHDTLMTGGDTPKPDQDGHFSIHWRKATGIAIMRGGYAFGLDKLRNRGLVAERKLPWTHPECGGYDTDCLMPGAYFAQAASGRRRVPLGEVAANYPVVLDYLAERVRFGIIDRTAGLDAATRLDVPSGAAVREYRELFDPKRMKRG